MNQYTVLSPFKDADGIHKPGETVSLADKDAAELLEIGSIEAAPVAAQAAVLSAADCQTAIIAAIAQMDKANIDLWLKDGKPDTNAIAEITGWPVTATERNTAWATLSATSAV